MNNGSGVIERPSLILTNNRQPKPQYVTREQMQLELKEAMIEIVGPLAHSFLQLEAEHKDLERRHIALCAHLGITYNPPKAKPDLSVSNGGAAGNEAETKAP